MFKFKVFFYFLKVKMIVISCLSLLDFLCTCNGNPAKVYTWCTVAMFLSPRKYDCRGRVPVCIHSLWLQCTVYLCVYNVLCTTGSWSTLYSADSARFTSSSLQLNQSINQSTNQSTNQSINQSIK